MTEVTVGLQSMQRFLPIVGQDHMHTATRLAEAVRQRLAGRTVWHVNSTSAGGGVAEMLPALLAYTRGAGVDARWVVIKGTPEFFRITKRLHHSLHGSCGDGSRLDRTARAVYEAVSRNNAANLVSALRSNDVVILHDPQTAGMAPRLIGAGAIVIWRCHIGHDTANDEVERGWRFLAPYLRDVPAFVFSRAAYVPDYCDHGKSSIITPSIDAFSPKNQELGTDTVRAILACAGLIDGPANSTEPAFMRDDGSPGRVDRRAEVLCAGPRPKWETRLVVQLSRWDPLKDPVGVLLGFADLVNGSAPGEAELMLAGPNVSAVTDDPEGALVFEQVVDAWRNLPEATRRRVHLASLPMVDLQENAAIVNAIQRHAAVIVQKSLHEGFGLTVTEAMWKARPIVASAVGGIQDQIEDGVHGLLLADPTDRAAFARALRELLENPERARSLGSNARERVRERFLGFHHLVEYARLIEHIDALHDRAGRPCRFGAREVDVAQRPAPRVRSKRRRVSTASGRPS